MEEGTRIKLRPRKKARIEIIPLIDVVFFLLATFVLFALSLNRIESLPVDLPVSSQRQQQPLQNKDLVTIQVSDQGALYWNRELFDLSELPGRLDQFKKDNQDPKILVAGDDRAHWETVVQVLDQIREAGIEKVSMETRTRPTGR
jgi:biopolymer transport protein ExbD